MLTQQQIHNSKRFNALNIVGQDLDRLAVNEKDPARRQAFIAASNAAKAEAAEIRPLLIQANIEEILD